MTKALTTITLRWPVMRYFIYEGAFLVREGVWFPEGTVLSTGGIQAYSMTGALPARNAGRAQQTVLLIHAYQLPQLDPEKPTQMRAAHSSTCVLHEDVKRNPHEKRKKEA